MIDLEKLTKGTKNIFFINNLLLNFDAVIGDSIHGDGKVLKYIINSFKNSHYKYYENSIKKYQGGYFGYYQISFFNTTTGENLLMRINKLDLLKYDFIPDGEKLLLELGEI